MIFFVFDGLTRFIAGYFLRIIEHFYQAGRVKRVDMLYPFRVLCLPRGMKQGGRISVVQLTRQVVLWKEQPQPLVAIHITLHRSRRIEPAEFQVL